MNAPAAVSVCLLNRPRLERNADLVVVALVVSLPWSTSATVVLGLLRLIEVCPNVGFS